MLFETMNELNGSIKSEITGAFGKVIQKVSLFTKPKVEKIDMETDQS
jgi:hypothetical protein